MILKSPLFDLCRFLRNCKMDIVRSDEEKYSSFSVNALNVIKGFTQRVILQTKYSSTLTDYEKTYITTDPFTVQWSYQK